MSLNNKTPEADLRKNHRVFIELGLIVVLVICIVAFKVNLPTQNSDQSKQVKQEVVKMKEVVRTQQKKQPPPPPEPQVPVEVPNDKVLKNQDINLDSDFDLNEKLSPPKPPQSGSKKGKKEKVFQAVQHMPTLTNKKEFYSSYEYPSSCKRAGIEGTVYISFVVSKTGEVTNAEVVRGIGGGCDEYALSYVKKHAKFSPGRQRGKTVAVKFTLPITFRLR